MRDVRLFHAHSLKRLGGAVLTAARLQKKPFVVTLHGGVFDVPAAELAEMLETHAHTVEWGKIFGLIFQSRRILEKADAVICIGQGEFEHARNSLSHDRIYHLGNGVDVERFSKGDGEVFRRQHGIPADAIVLACYSRFDPQKDQLCLIDAFDQLAAAHPKLHLVLAGPCTVPTYLARLDSRIAESLFRHRIRRLGSIPSGGRDLPDAYHGCDLFVLPSRHEPFGIVVLEAWSAGKAVVVSHVGGLRNLVTAGENGLFFPAGDPAALAAKIKSLLDAPSLQTRLAAAGRQHASENYSWDMIGTETERIYQTAEANAEAAFSPRR